MLQVQVPLLLFILFGLLNVVLFRWKGGTVISLQECCLATVGLGEVALRFHALDYFLHHNSHNHRSHLHTKRHQNKKTLQKTTLFKQSFLLLSTSEVLLTIVAPWIIILLGFGSPPQQQHVSMMAHLFAFQAQIAWEACLLGQSKQQHVQEHHRDVELWVYTVVANAYRGWILFQTRPTTVMNDDTITIVDVILWRVTTALWCGSSFIFMPWIWYPCLVVVPPPAAVSAAAPVNNEKGTRTATTTTTTTRATKEHSS
jgi:hypothetical protein